MADIVTSCPYFQEWTNLTEVPTATACPFRDQNDIVANPLPPPDTYYHGWECTCLLNTDLAHTGHTEPWNIHVDAGCYAMSPPGTVTDIPGDTPVADTEPYIPEPGGAWDRRFVPPPDYPPYTPPDWGDIEIDEDNDGEPDLPDEPFESIPEDYEACPWLRTRTSDILYGYCTVECVRGFRLLDLEGIPLEHFYKYNVVSPFVKD